MHFKATWDAPEEESGWYYIDAENDIEARKQIIKMLQEDEEPFKEDSLQIVKVPTSELIDDILLSAKGQMLQLYIGLHCVGSDVTVREYGRMQKQLDTDEEFKLKVYRDVQRYHRTWRMIKKYCDTDKMTATEIFKVVDELWRKEEGADFQKIWMNLPKK